MLLTGKRITKNLNDGVTPCLKLKIRNSEIQKVSDLYLFGLTYDRNMTFGPHIDQLCKKLSKRLGLFLAYTPIPEEAIKESVLQRNYET